MAKYENFYETVKEAEMRLLNTVVCYEGEPYYVIAITNHKGDGKYRIYLDKLGFNPKGLAIQRIPGIPYEYYDGTNENVSRGNKMDAWLENNPNSGIIRKFMSSRGFDNYRPFPLGMCNLQGKTYFLERQPQRITQQGLVNQMVKSTCVDLASQSTGRGSQRGVPNLMGMEMYMTITGQYPDPEECIKNLRDPKIANTSVGFHRNFAVVRGPINTLFLAYKDEIIGFLPNLDFSVVCLGLDFKHTREVVDALKLFKDIRVG